MDLLLVKRGNILRLAFLFYEVNRAQVFRVEHRHLQIVFVSSVSHNVVISGNRFRYKAQDRKIYFSFSNPTKGIPRI